MRFGLFGGPSSSAAGGYAEFIDFAVEAERLGFVSTFLTEHHFTGLGQASAPLVVLGHLAARTTTMRLGTAVAVLPWHNPVAVAEQAATVDELSGGRLDFGVGPGVSAAEFDGFGMSMAEATERYQEALEVILKAWSSRGRWSHDGRFWTYRDVAVEPPPRQLPHPPVWVGAGSPESLRGAADRGFRLLLDQVASFELTGERIAVYRDRLAELGRPFAAGVDVAVTRSLHLVDGPRERAAAIERRVEAIGRMAALATAGRGPQNRMSAEYSADIRRATEEGAIIGDAAECAERLELLRAHGAEYVLLICETDRPEMLRAFAREVMPRVERTATRRAERTPRRGSRAAPH
jgi:alkanesulfonate monooxygenase SsuD/methylene tetrahydromethanopterin reductase-like flavin-dependent oxidoreductase (luciferase family)